MQESQTTFIKELLTDNKVVGKEHNPARTDLMTSKKYEIPPTEVEHSQFCYCSESPSELSERAYTTKPQGLVAFTKVPQWTSPPSSGVQAELTPALGLL
jgi:hypothetical protein